HLEVERLADLGLEARHVVVADMAAILAQMRGDTRRSGGGRDLRGTPRIRIGAAARIARGRGGVGGEAGARRAKIGDAGNSSWSGKPHAFTRSACATTSLARSCAMIEVRCLRS